MFGTSENRHRGVQIEKFPSAFDATRSEEDAAYWKDLEFPVTVQEKSPVNYVDIRPSDPRYIAVTGSLSVRIYDPSTNEVRKTLTKFKDAVYGGRFRRNDGGGLLALGDEVGAVQIFDPSSKTRLRTFKGHASAVKRVDFFQDGRSLASFSDDRSSKVWDVASESLVTTFEGHTDYVRCGSASGTSSDVLVTGSYDHAVKLWDKRKEECVMTLSHGAPVEDVLFFTRGSLLASAGGHEIRVWDLLSGKLLSKMTPHAKTITSLTLSNGGTRLVSSSLDRRIRFHDVSTFASTHSISFSSPVLTCQIASDDSVICAGTTDGLVQFLHRKERASREEKEEMRDRQRRPFLRFVDFKPAENDIVVKENKDAKEARHDYFLRKFEYTKALDSVLKPFVQKRHPDYAFSVLKELKRRNGLAQALAGRDEKSLSLLLQFLSKNIAEAKYASLVIDVTELLLDLYWDDLGRCKAVDRLFATIAKKVDRETRNMRTLMTLSGSLDMILSAAKISEEPVLRREERDFKNDDSAKEASLSSVPLAWEKILCES